MKQFDRFKEQEVNLTKIEALREAKYVSAGNSQSGEMNVHTWSDGKISVVVMRGFKGYLRTSPVVKVLDETENSLRFQTEGGIYLMELNYEKR